MTDSTAKKWLVISALSVFGIWWYRRWREGPSVVLEAPKFIAAWGATYFTLALITEASPSFGGSFSILVMVGDLLGNAMPKKGGGILKDIVSQQGGEAAKGSPVGGWGAASQAGSGLTAAGTGLAGAAGGTAVGQGANQPASPTTPNPSAPIPIG